MAKGRSHYTGTCDELSSTLSRFARDVEFVSYPDESVTLDDAKLHIESVMGHCRLLHALWHLQPNLSFPRKLVEKARTSIADKNPKWFRNEAETN